MRSAERHGTQVHRDCNQDFRSEYTPINNLFELNESLDYYDPYICYSFSWKFGLLCPNIIVAEDT